jgi:hypothetical protein
VKYLQIKLDPFHDFLTNNPVLLNIPVSTHYFPKGKAKPSFSLFCNIAGKNGKNESPELSTV